MKTIIPFILILNLISLKSYSQNSTLWTTATAGGINGYGTILKSDNTGNNFQAVASFNLANGSYPQGNMVIESNGKMYGTTRRGGFSNSCVIYSFDTSTNSISNIYDFMYNTSVGAIPYSGMITGADSMLYGVTNDGGANGSGVIYQYDFVNDNYTDLYDFIDSTGRNSFGELLQLNDGNLYGLCSAGGISGNGVIFKYDLTNNQYSVLHYFDNLTGNNPAYNHLIKCSDGKLYGTCKEGGAYGSGVIFSYDLTTATYTDLHDFDNSHGAYPFGSLLQANDSLLYGLTIIGGLNNLGVFFNFNIATDSFNLLVNFNGTNGAKPQRGLTQVSNGKLYGTTMEGGNSNFGVIFNWDISMHTFTKVLDFDSTNTGANPTSDILEIPSQINLNVNSLSSQDKFLVYPIPSNNSITIESDDKSEIQFIDVYGKLIQKSIPTQRKTTIDISAFPSVFFIKQNNDELKKVLKE